MRFGVAGIFISRFLPGVRAVVPPFAGLVDLGWIRTLGPMGLASAIWYGGITMVGALLGAEWSRIVAIIAGVNRTLAIVARGGRGCGRDLVLARRRRRKQERVWHATRDALTQRRPRSSRAPSWPRGRPARPQPCWSWSWLTPTRCSRRAIARRSPRTCGSVGASAARPTRPSRTRGRAAQPFRRLCREGARALRPLQRLELVERMWLAAFSDGGAIGAHEDRLMSTAAELLGVDRAEVTEVRRRLSGNRARDDRRGLATRWIAPSGSRASATISASRPGTARTRWTPTCGISGGWASSRWRAGCASRPGHPHASSAISSTCSRTWGSAPRRSGAACPPSGPTTAFWPARAACATTPATGWKRHAAAGFCPTPSPWRRSSPSSRRRASTTRSPGAIARCWSWRTAPGCACPSSAASASPTCCSPRDLVRVFGKGAEGTAGPARTEDDRRGIGLPASAPPEPGSRDRAAAGCCSMRGESRSPGSAPGAS